MWRRDPGGWRASRTRAARARPGFGADVLIVGAEGGGDGATERREKGRKSGKFEVLRGNQGRSAGGTTEEEHAVPAGEAGDHLLGNWRPNPDFEYLTGIRDEAGAVLLLDPTAPTSEAALLEELSAEFEAHDDFKRLVKRLIMLPQYRRTP